MRRAAGLCCTGIGAGGRATAAEDGVGADVVALTKLVRGWPERGGGAVAAAGVSGAFSAGFGSTRNSVGFGSSGDMSAPTGRGRGSGLDSAADDGAGRLITVPNIGAGCRPVCRNNALATMAQTA